MEKIGRDLNDLWYFASVVSHEGYTAAARVTGVSKASLSKGVSRLEARLQLRLIERSTRRFRVTDIGQELFRHCQAMLENVEAAEALAARAFAEPSGSLRMSCPQGLLQGLITSLLPGFLMRYPKVRLQVLAINGSVDMIEEGIDLALGVRELMPVEGSLIARTLGSIHLIMVAAPAFLAQHPVVRLEDVKALPTLSLLGDADRSRWELVGPDGLMQEIHVRPRLDCGDLIVLREAAMQGAGIAALPEHVCKRQLQSGELVQVMPGWSSQTGTIQAVFTTRKGLRPSVRALIDFLVEQMPVALERTAPATTEQMSAAIDQTPVAIEQMPMATGPISQSAE